MDAKADERVCCAFSLSFSLDEIEMDGGRTILPECRDRRSMLEFEAIVCRVDRLQAKVGK